MDTAASPLARAKTVVFRRLITFRRYLSATKAGAHSRRQAHKLREQQAKDARLRDFFGWCSGCEAYGSIF